MPAGAANAATRSAVRCGGHYEGELDTQAPYLRQFLGFIGITDLELVIADRLAFGETIRAESLAAAYAAAA